MVVLFACVVNLAGFLVVFTVNGRFVDVGIVGLVGNVGLLGTVGLLNVGLVGTGLLVDIGGFRVVAIVRLGFGVVVTFTFLSNITISCSSWKVP